MSYEVGKDWGKAATDFENVFGIHIKHFFDGFMTLMAKKICINIFKFDDWLQSKHKDYVDGVSLNDILLQKYGEKGLKLVHELSGAG
jgi:hypothetical protein